jgi:hypothetical protein
MHGLNIRVKTRAESLVENLVKNKGYGRQKSAKEIILKMFVAKLIQEKKGVYKWL